MKVISGKGFAMVWILALSNALAASTLSAMMLVGSLVGIILAPSADWATLPIAVIVVGTAMGVYPATRAMAMLGRKRALALSMLLGILACGLAAFSLEIKSFVLFCIASLFLGVTNAALLQTRFAAMELVDPASGSAAASLIMCGGIIAAVLGPELAVMGMNITAVDYQGAFYLAGLCLLLGMLVLTAYRPGAMSVVDKQASVRSAGQLMRNPTFYLALTSAVVAYIIMSFVMTGTPISMHHVHGHSLEDTKFVIQSHIAAMFLPSMIAPFIFRAVGIRGTMILGLLCYCVTIVLASLDTSVQGFWFQLVFLGVGWNFLFLAGTSLLPSAYSESEKYKAQALNDGIVFSAQAIAALSAGWAMTLLSWPQMLIICIAPVLLMVAMLVQGRLKESGAQ